MSRKAVIESIIHFLDYYLDEGKLAFQDATGKEIWTCLCPAMDRPKHEDPCTADILWDLQQSGNRLTCAAILAAFEHKGVEWSERHVKEKLVDVQEDGLIDNVKPRGYGLCLTEGTR